MGRRGGARSALWLTTFFALKFCISHVSSAKAFVVSGPCSNTTSPPCLYSPRPTERGARNVPIDRDVEIYNQECGLLYRVRYEFDGKVCRDRKVCRSICASVASVAELRAMPPVKCLIFADPTSRIAASSQGCWKSWWGLKNRTQRLFATETDYVSVKAFCFVHASSRGKGGSKDGRLHPPDPYFVAIPYVSPAYANGNVQAVVNALLARPRQRSSSALIIGTLRSGWADGDVENEKHAASKLRTALLAACQREPSCQAHQPVPSWQNAAPEIYATVDYCLMPPGDTATRAGWFHALSGLCVPVFFSSCLPLSDGGTLNRPLVYDSMYAPLLPFTHRVKFGAGVWSVVLDANRALANGSYVFHALRALNASAMRKNIASFVHRLQRESVREYISERTAENSAEA